MPAKSEKQRRFFAAELRRKREGKKTQTGLSEAKLEEFASMPHKDKMKSPPAGTQGFTSLPSAAGGSPTPPSSFSPLPSRQDLATAAVPPAAPSHSPAGRPGGVQMNSGREMKGDAPQNVMGGPKMIPGGGRLDMIPADVRSFDPLPERES